MTVHAIPFEHLRYFVESQSGREPYTVDLHYQEEPWRRPSAFCGCWRVFCGHERLCKHIEAVVNWELNRIHQNEP